MKRWLLYFFAVALCTISAPFAADAVFRTEGGPIITVYSNGSVDEMSVEDYTLRVLLAEGKTTENTESKKALAIAVRSCALYLSFYGCKHDDFDVCDNGSCCLPLADPVNAEPEYLDSCQTAVKETVGTALCCGYEPAMALFTLCAGSGTADCEEFTYLTSVSEESRCEDHITKAEFDFSALEPLLPNGVTVDTKNIAESSVLVYGENKKCEFGIFGGEMIGNDIIKEALSLPSSEYVLEFTDSGILATCYGAGNGYGLNLCGADKMAKNGFDYKSILEFYYPDLILNKIYHN